MPVTCDPKTLASEAACFNCLEPRSVEAVKAYLLCQLLKILNPLMACDVKSLMAESTCFLCAEPRQLAAIQTNLLCLILAAASGGGGLGANVLCGDSDPVNDPLVDCALYYNTLKGWLWNWDDANSKWTPLISA